MQTPCLPSIRAFYPDAVRRINSIGLICAKPPLISLLAMWISGWAGSISSGGEMVGLFFADVVSWPGIYGPFYLPDFEQLRIPMGSPR